MTIGGGEPLNLLQKCFNIEWVAEVRCNAVEGKGVASLPMNFHSMCNGTLVATHSVVGEKGSEHHLGKALSGDSLVYLFEGAMVVPHRYKSGDATFALYASGQCLGEYLERRSLRPPYLGIFVSGLGSS